MNRLLRSLLTVALFVLVAAACVPSGEPVSWEDQADGTGEGLVERELVASCLEANADLGSVKAKRFCTCVLDGLQALFLIHICRCRRQLRCRIWRPPELQTTPP